jgi:hypothetical protein
MHENALVCSVLKRPQARISSMSKTITRLYDDYAHAAAAVVALERLDES